MHCASPAEVVRASPSAALRPGQPAAGGLEPGGGEPRVRMWRPRLTWLWL